MTHKDYMRVWTRSRRSVGVPRGRAQPRLTVKGWPGASFGVYKLSELVYIRYTPSMQRLDDVTGDPIRLSATQREQQREAMIAMINAQTTQINTLTAEARAQRAVIANLVADLDSFQARPFVARVRWFLTGR